MKKDAKDFANVCSQISIAQKFVGVKETEQGYWLC